MIATYCLYRAEPDLMSDLFLLAAIMIFTLLVLGWIMKVFKSYLSKRGSIDPTVR